MMAYTRFDLVWFGFILIRYLYIKKQNWQDDDSCYRYLFWTWPIKRDQTENENENEILKLKLKFKLWCIYKRYSPPPPYINTHSNSHSHPSQFPNSLQIIPGPCGSTFKSSITFFFFAQISTISQFRELFQFYILIKT